MSRSIIFSAALALYAFTSFNSFAETTLRVVPSTDLGMLDPHATTSVTTQMHGLLIYDVLFGLDIDEQPQPQMIEDYTVSEDRLSYSFTLRDQLEFHDGTPVETNDVIASLHRWIKNDVVGGQLGAVLDDVQAVDSKTFTLRLREAFPVEAAFAAASSKFFFILREEDANKPVTVGLAAEGAIEQIGSGPFKFERSEWRPGARVVYTKNEKYVPRSDPSNAYAGAKIPMVDRVEFNIIPDPSTKVSALLNNEVDFLDLLSTDLARSLQGNGEVTVEPLLKLPFQAFIRLNSLHSPFDNVKARQAVALAVNQGDFMAAAFGTDDLWEVCHAFFVCGSANGTEVGSEDFREKNIERAKQLLAESGYNGEPVVLLSSHELDYIGAMTDVTAAAMREIGINVDQAESDWGTMISRRAVKAPPSQGGWNAFTTGLSGFAQSSPLTNALTEQKCEETSFAGWPCSPESEALRTAWIRAAPDQKPALLEQLHTKLWSDMPSVLIGQWIQLYAWRNELRGVQKFPSQQLGFWGISKE